MLKEFFLGFIKIHILFHAAQQPVYGTELIRELAGHGYEIGPGTMYPTLHGLEQQGLLQSEPQNVGGRIRKYYRITPQGLAALEEAKIKIRELVREVLD